MAKLRTIQLYRGTTAQNDAYTGAAGELTMDTTETELRLHDGSTAGGKKIGAGYHPDLFDHKWADHILNDVSWLRADTFSWQDGSVYQAAYNHLSTELYSGTTIDNLWAAKINNVWYYRDYEKDVSGETYQYAYTSFFGNTVQTIYSATQIGNTTYNMDFYNGPTSTATLFASVTSHDDFDRDLVYVPQRETVAGIVILVYNASDGHKIVLANQESNVAAIYAATGVAWYYIIDTTNQRFKLPRENPNKKLLKEISSSPVVFEDTNNQVQLAYGRRSATFDLYLGIGSVPGGCNALWYRSGQHDPTQGTYDSVPAPAFHTIKTNISYNTFYQGEQYLYFYVGNFTQTALENTAGITAETLNGKVDKGHQVIDFQEPTSANGYTWYRKYADGWVEQGGIWTGSISATSGNDGLTTINLPVIMTDTNYCVNITNNSGTGTAAVWEMWIVESLTTTQFVIHMGAYANTRTITRMNWEVKGMAA